MMDIIQTPCGAIRGVRCQWPGVRAFRGIRYATAGRWQYPVPVTHWDGVYEADHYGNCCYQPRTFYAETASSETAFYYHEFREGEAYTYSEDCLFLNIWTPEHVNPGDRLPVLFYIHGGGFTGGCGHEKHFDGPVWPTKGVIAVTINYRLGPLGFVCLPELKREVGHTGNYGLFDQATALQWVHDNIAAFGGDPTRITVMGQSAGAMSVQQLCVSPVTDGLFSGAVMSSGGGIDPHFSTAPADVSCYPFWQTVMAYGGCPDLASFRSLAPERLFQAWNTARAANPDMGRRTAGPCLDGVLLPETALDTARAGKQKNIPYLMSSTSHDIVPPIVHKMAKSWCRLQWEQGKQPSYAMLFDRMLPGDHRGAWHSSDLWYWFGTLAHCWRPMTEYDWLLSGQMVDYLMQFVKTGNPNGDGLPQWLPAAKGQSKVLRIGQTPAHMGMVNLARLNQIMQANPADGE